MGRRENRKRQQQAFRSCLIEAAEDLLAVLINGSSICESRPGCCGRFHIAKTRRQRLNVGPFQFNKGNGP